MKDARHFLYAVGVGLATALALIPATGDVNWRNVGVEGAKAVLFALGITLLVRKDNDS